MILWISFKIVRMGKQSETRTKRDYLRINHILIWALGSDSRKKWWTSLSNRFKDRTHLPWAKEITLSSTKQMFGSSTQEAKEWSSSMILYWTATTTIRPTHTMNSRIESWWLYSNNLYNRSWMIKNDINNWNAGSLTWDCSSSRLFISSPWMWATQYH